MTPRPAFVYRLYDADEQLVYVGSSYFPKRRIASHRRRFAFVRYEVNEYPDRRTAYRAEARAIRLCGPLLNVQHSRREVA